MSADPEAPMISVDGPSEGEFRWALVISEDRARADVGRLIEEGLEQTDDNAMRQLWIRGVEPGDDSIAESYGFIAYRDIWQLRCPLPAAPSSIDTRSFVAADLPQLVDVNNRAFHWHPEQGGRTAADLSEVMAEGWFDPDGLRLHHVGDRLAGFCWTKIHADHDPPLGEIFVIAVDPDFHGQGLGVPMTLAGLDWLSERGLSQGMLYVESDNHAANATYARIGFTRHRTDRAFRRDPQS